MDGKHIPEASYTKSFKGPTESHKVPLSGTSLAHAMSSHGIAFSPYKPINSKENFVTPDLQQYCDYMYFTLMFEEKWVGKWHTWKLLSHAVTFMALHGPSN